MQNELINPAAVQTTKIGPNRGKAKQRVWIEGNNLIVAGFTRGARYSRALVNGSIVLETVPADYDGKSYKVSGKAEKPIIDIVGKIIVDNFSHLDSVPVAFYRGAIVIG